MKNTFKDLFEEHAEFSDQTFGSKRNPIGPINHLKKEVEELSQEPYDFEEYADCLLLLMDAFRRAGGTPSLLLDVSFAKLEKNKTRAWGKPDANGVIEHIKSAE